MPNFNFTTWIGDTFGSPVPFNIQISELSNKNDTLNNSITTLQGQVNQLTSTLTSTQNQDKATIAGLEAKLAPNPKEVYWNTRYPKISQNYLRWEKYGNRATQYQIDVRNFIDPLDDNLPTISGTTNDEKALNSLIWVIDNVNYSNDFDTWGQDEYWALPYETLNAKKGDCEDGAHLLHSIMLKNGIPYWMIRSNAGNVNGGGHCYITYCRETDNQFVVLDWCYWPSKQPVSQRKLHKDEMNYDDPLHNYGIWFSWNQKYCFGQMQTMVGMPDYFSSK